MKKWEYLKLTGEEPSLKLMNQYGEEGWELVIVTPMTIDEYQPITQVVRFMAIFKRERQI